MTPGIVELGKEEVSANEELGRVAAGTCDLVILVGRERARPIQAGLRSGGFPDGNVFVVDSLSEGRSHLARIGRAGDVVLLENDLPDLYAS